jgi:hypothetical protein
MIPKTGMAMMGSIKYIAGLIDDLVVKVTPEKRMMLGGFSPGNDMSLLILKY